MILLTFGKLFDIGACDLNLLGPLLDVWVHKERLQHRCWVCQSGGFNHDGIQGFLPTQQLGENADEVASHCMIIKLNALEIDIKHVHVWEQC